MTFFIICSNHPFFPISALFSNINLTSCIVSLSGCLPTFQSFVSVSRLHPQFWLPILIGLSIMHYVTLQTGLVPLQLPLRLRKIDWVIPDTMAIHSMNMLSSSNFIQYGRASAVDFKTKNNAGVFGPNLFYNRKQHSERHFSENTSAH